MATIERRKYFLALNDGAKTIDSVPRLKSRDYASRTSAEFDC